MRSFALAWVLGPIALFMMAAATAGPGNPGVVSIADPTAYSAVYAISDVHGMYDALQKILTENHLIDSAGHWSGGRALLVVVGDSIDKGSRSIEVLDEWMRLQPEAQAAGGQVLHLLGNHEAEFLADPTDDSKAKALFAELKARGIPPEQLSSDAYPRGHFIRSEPLAARVGNWLFSHSGFMPEMSLSELTSQASSLLNAGSYGNAFFIGGESILESQKWWEPGSATRAQLEARLDRAGLAGSLFGHQPKALNVVGQSAISEDGRLIKIDNGMAPEAGAHPGSLLVFPNPADLLAAKGRSPEVYELVNGVRRMLAPESRIEPAGGEAEE
jgi:hypothetical protein